MSKQANPAAVGFFALAGLALAFAAVVIFGSGLLKTREKFILYFEDSVQGLNVGAPVKFKGVTIGEVTEILIRYRQPRDSAHLPVFIEVDTKSLQEKHNVSIDLSDPDELRTQINNGLRATLQQGSLVTGRNFIELDYHPEILESPEFVQLDEGPADQPAFPEIPTLRFEITETLQRLTRMVNDISQIDFPRLADGVQSTLDHSSSFMALANVRLQQLDMVTLNQEAVTVLEKLRALLDDPEMQTAANRFNQAMGDLSSAATEYEALAMEVSPLVADLRGASQQATLSLQRAEALMNGLNATVAASDSTLQRNLNRTLDEVRAAARSINQLADYLERNPSSLLTGRNANP